MLIIITILSIIVIFLIIKLLLYKFELKNYVKQLKFIQNEDTNLEITTQISSKEIQAVVDEMNVFINNNKQFKREIRHSNLIFKQTITNVSHDLRTPLTSISGYLKMLQSKDLDEHKRIEYINAINIRIESTKKLISQLFEYTRIETGEINFDIQKVNFSEIVRQKLLSYYESFIEKSFQVSLNLSASDIFIKADAEALERVIENLVANALIHGEKELIVELYKKNENVYFVMENLSYDIDKEEIDNIFDRFYTTDKSRTKRTTGLGLSITKRLVVHMQGKINAYYNMGRFGIEIYFPVYRRTLQ